MSIVEYGSIQIKALEMISLLNQVQYLKSTEPVIIIGEPSTGKMTLAQYIQNNIFKDQSVAVFRGLSEFKSTTKAGIFTVSKLDWLDAQSQFRLTNVQFLNMPSLAERKNDLPQLAEFFLQVLSLMNNKPKVKLTEKALEKILQYDWPNQFCEFESILENAFMTADNSVIEPELLIMGPLNSDVGIPAGMKLDELERKYILQTLYFVHQNRTKAAEILGISIRTLRNKINQYRVEGFL